MRGQGNTKREEFAVIGFAPSSAQPFSAAIPRQDRAYRLLRVVTNVTTDGTAGPREIRLYHRLRAPQLDLMVSPAPSVDASDDVTASWFPNAEQTTQLGIRTAPIPADFVVSDLDVISVNVINANAGDAIVSCTALVRWLE